MLRTLIARAPWGRSAAAAAGLAATAAAAAAWAPSSPVFLSTARADAPPGAGSLNPDAWTPFTLKAKTRESHDTVRLTFALADPGATASSVMPVASCLMARLPVGEGGKQVAKPYTPCDAPSSRGAITLVVKAYPTGTLSPALAALEPGQAVELKGPFPKLEWRANKWSDVAFVVGGTGITPALQVLYHSLADPADRTRFTLVYGSRSPADVICRSEIDALAAAHPGRLAVHYLVDAAAPGAPGLVPGKGNVRVGRPDKAVLASVLPPPVAGRSLVAVCGPGPMMAAVCGNKEKVAGGPPRQGAIVGALGELGYNNDTAFKF
jgi:cytochrome-b5 reductase